MNMNTVVRMNASALVCAVAVSLGALAAVKVNLRPWEGTRRTLKAEGQTARRAARPRRAA